MTIAGISEIVRNAFGLWITALFDGILVPNAALTFDEHSEAFFWLVEKLLREGKIRFRPPNEFWHEGYDVWDADADTTLEYLRSRWPVDATSEKDILLTNYFYDIPAILWIAPDGTLHGS